MRIRMWAIEHGVLAPCIEDIGASDRVNAKVAKKILNELRKAGYHAAASEPSGLIHEISLRAKRVRLWARHFRRYWNNEHGTIVIRGAAGLTVKNVIVNKIDDWARSGHVFISAPFMRPKLAAHEFVSDNEDSSRSKDAERARLLAQDPEVRRLLETIAEKHGQLPDKEEVIQ